MIKTSKYIACCYAATGGGSRVANDSEHAYNVDVSLLFMSLFAGTGIRAAPAGCAV